MIFSDISKMENQARSPEHVFHLATPAHMLTKLWWEIRRLNDEIAKAHQSVRGIEYLSYCAFNTAVTATHCADWMWRSLDADTREKLAIRFSFSLRSNDRKNLEGFVSAVCKAHRPLDICRSIANGSKHMGAEKKPEIAFAVKTVWQFRAGDPPRTECYLAVDDVDGEHRVEDVFASAFEFWERLFGELYLIEGRYVGPSR
jgi:hypothetical protein